MVERGGLRQVELLPTPAQAFFTVVLFRPPFSISVSTFGVCMEIPDGSGGDKRLVVHQHFFSSPSLGVGWIGLGNVPALLRQRLVNVSRWNSEKGRLFHCSLY